MLSESFIAASSAPPASVTANSSLLKDAGIYFHSFQPQPGLRSTFKKTKSSANCVAVNDEHVFAAQADKAVVQVYNREKGSHEATIPFSEHIHSITLFNDNTALALGTQSGSILLWELATGRLVSTSASHLQPVTVLAADLSNDFILSGSADSTVQVWSVIDLLSFPSQSSTAQDKRTPRQTLTAHTGPITAILPGSSFTPSNIAVTTSSDNTAIIWDYRTGKQLRTFLLPSAPLCAALDPAERGFYVGYDDGSVQLISFYPTTEATLLNIRHPLPGHAPITPPPSSRWPSPPSTGAALSCSLSFDATTLLTGHATGTILRWDIATGRPLPLLATYEAAPITALTFLPPTGFPNTAPPHIRIPAVVKPRPLDAPDAAYKVHVMFPTALDTGSVLDEDDAGDVGVSEFEAAMGHWAFPLRMLEEGIAELEAWEDEEAVEVGKGKKRARGEERDYVMLDERSEEAKRAQELEAQVKHLKKVNRVATEQVGKLVREKKELEEREDEWKRKEDERYERRKRRVDRTWEKVHGGEDGAADDNDIEVNSLTSGGEEDDSVPVLGVD